MKFKNIYIIAGTCLIIGVGIGIFIQRLLPDSCMQKTKELRQTGYMYTSPLLECESTEQSITTELIPFKTELTNSINQLISQGKATHISLYFRDLISGPWIGINENEPFSPASMLKVPLLLSYFKVIQKNPEILKQELEYIGKSILPEEERDTPITLKDSKSYTVDDLINRMIIFSDNAASHVLYDHLDKQSIADPYTMLELEIPYSKPGDYMIPVRKYSSFFRILFNASYLSPEFSEKALSLLSKTQFSQGLKAGVPAEIEVAHKYGERIFIEGQKVNQLHDCGIVYYPQHPYILCIMTKGTNLENLSSAITTLSKLTYQIIDRQIRSAR